MQELETKTAPIQEREESPRERNARERAEAARKRYDDSRKGYSANTMYAAFFTGITGLGGVLASSLGIFAAPILIVSVSATAYFGKCALDAWRGLREFEINYHERREDLRTIKHAQLESQLIVKEFEKAVSNKDLTITLSKSDDNKKNWADMVASNANEVSAVENNR